MERTASRRRKRQPEADNALRDVPHQENEVEDRPQAPAKSTYSTAFLAFVLSAAVLILFRLFSPSSLSVSLSSPDSPPETPESSPSPSRLSASLLHPHDHIHRPPTTISLDWKITSGLRRPDGVSKLVYLINNAFPGPTIEVRSGDHLLINVTNGLSSEGISIHWHGLHMRGANAMDGVSGITQCPISPSASFLYNFTISASQSGTFWYHSHTGLQRGDGLFGGLVIHKPASASRNIHSREIRTDHLRYKYEQEHLLLIGDWYHRPSEKVLEWYMRAASYGNEPVPDSLLINGAGHFNCSMAVPARPLDCVATSPPKLPLDPKFSHRLRIVNTGSLAGFTLHFDGNVRLIQIDGGIDVEPTEKARSAGVLYPGQRMDLVLQQKITSLTVELDPECFKYPNHALTRTQLFPILSTSRRRGLTFSWNNRHIDLAQVASTKAAISAIPAQPDKTFMVYTKISKLSVNANAPFGYFNHTSWRPQVDPPYSLITLNRSKWDENQLSLSTGSKPVWIDFIVNNLDEGPHPFHLHGHNFFVISIFESTIGWGSYNPYQPHLNPSPRPPYDLTKALERDTVLIPRRGHAVLRLRADNPGVWLFHCHILWHLASGMAMLLEVMNENYIDTGAEMCQYTF